MKQYLCLFIFCFIRLIAYNQDHNMNKSKFLSNKEVQEKLLKFNGKLNETYGDSFPDTYIYDLDNNMVITQNVKSKLGVLHLDKRTYYDGIDLALKRKNQENDFFIWNAYLDNIDSNKQYLLTELKVKLRLKILLNKYDTNYFQTIDKGIRLFGYSKSYNELFLPMVIYVGEMIKQKLGGRWEVVKDINYTNNDQKRLMLKINENINLDIGGTISKSYYKQNKINIENIINYFTLNPKVRVFPAPR
jgi:hypothetical protein